MGSSPSSCILFIYNVTNLTQSHVCVIDNMTRYVEHEPVMTSKSDFARRYRSSHLQVMSLTRFLCATANYKYKFDTNDTCSPTQYICKYNGKQLLLALATISLLYRKVKKVHISLTAQLPCCPVRLTAQHLRCAVDISVVNALRFDNNVNSIAVHITNHTTSLLSGWAHRTTSSLCG